ncbi:MAG TPA: HAD hydrolase-like protein, partial [Caldimonas sp.]|nr:HAD hydrolase-like protein [Caldimonas sp.]
MIRAVILDLDGTLLDTSGEIATAMNRTLDEMRLARIPAKDIESMIGRGVPKLVERVLAKLGARDVDAGALLERFEAHYAQTVGTRAPL